MFVTEYSTFMLGGEYLIEFVSAKVCVWNSLVCWFEIG